MKSQSKTAKEKEISTTRMRKSTPFNKKTGKMKSSPTSSTKITGTATPIRTPMTIGL